MNKKITFRLLVLIMAISNSTLSNAQTKVCYAGGINNEAFYAVMQLSNETFLVSGTANDLNWIDAAVPRTQLTISGITNNQGTNKIPFILQLSADLNTILQVVYLPQNAAEDIKYLKTTNLKGEATANIYLSGTTNDSNNGGYFIAKLNNNFVNGIPTALAWAYSVKAGGDHKTNQSWDVGSDGKVVYATGTPFDYNWAAVYRLQANGTDDVVPNWRWHWGINSNGAATELGGFTPISNAPAGSTVTKSGIVFKTWGRCDLRSWTQADYDLIESDGNGGTKKGKYPMDYFFNSPCNPATPTADGPGYTGYGMGSNPTQHVGGIAIDKRNNHIYLGFSIQSTLPDGQPDFEPAVMAFDNTGNLKWWSRLYEETNANSSPDQYVDGLAIDYSMPPNTANLVVLARCHGNNTVNLWEGNQINANPSANAYQNGFTGTQGNIHISWIGKLGLDNGTLTASTYLAEFVEGSNNYGAASADPNLGNWPNPNSGWPNLNTTRAKNTLLTTADGSVLVTAVGRRTMTTLNAHQTMPLPTSGQTGAWNSFVRQYSPNFSGVTYSSLITGAWDTATGAGADNTVLLGLCKTANGIVVVGYHEADAANAPNYSEGNPIPTTNLPAWGNAIPQQQQAIIAYLTADNLTNPNDSPANNACSSFQNNLNINGIINVCTNNNSTYSVPAIAGSTYIWTITGGNITAGQGTHQITVQWNNGTVGTVSVVQTVE